MQGKSIWTRSLDSDHECLRTRCLDGTLSYPILRVYDGTPRPSAEIVENLIKEFLSSSFGASRIPPCPPPVATLLAARYDARLADLLRSPKVGADDTIAAI